jgi:type I restriction enzyme S subunit
MPEELKSYSQYSESEVAWLRQFPSHWEKLPGLAILYEKQNKNIGLIEKRVLSLSYGKIVIKPNERLHGLVPESFETYQIVEPGDIIIRSTDLQNDKVSLRVGEVKDKGIITSAYLCLRAKNGVTAKYAYLMLHTLDLTKALYGLGSGLRQNLSWTDFKRLPFFIPPIDEQEQIIRYLEWKTTQINKFIKAKKRMIELLKEQKQVIIDEAVSGKVTHLTSNSLTTESWSRTKLKRLSRKITDGEHLSPTFTDFGVPFLSAQDVRDREINFEVKKYVSREDAKKMRMRCNPQSGDLLIVSRGATIGRIGLVESDKEFCLLGSVILVKPNKRVNSRFLYYLLSSKGVQEKLCLSSQASAQPAIYIVDVSELPVYLPSFTMQTEIVEYIENREEPIKNMLCKIEREVCLISEYKTSLIQEVVTGKIDLKDICIPEITTDLDFDIELKEEVAEEYDDPIRI